MTTESQEIEFDGAKLTDLREERGFSQAEVARTIGGSDRNLYAASRKTNIILRR